MTTSSTLRNAKLYGNEIIQTPIGDIELVHNYFDSEASQRLFDEMDYQRACQTYLWSHPLVSTTTWRDRQAAAYGVKDPYDFVVLRSLKEKRGIVTANLTTPYIVNFTSLKAGPLVVDYPAGDTAGAFMDFWQRPVADVGLTGPDQGQGAKYIIVGPEDDPQKYEEEGVYVIQSATNNLFFGLRILNPDPDFYEQFKSSLQMGQDGQSLQTVNFIEDGDVEWSATAPRGIEYWQVLSSIINEEPVRVVDKAWMAMLLPLGIEKGKTFNPDERQTSILLEGGAMGELMARNLQVNPRFAEFYWEGTQWYKSFDFTLPQETDTRVELDERTTWFYEAVTSTEGMVNPTPGKGQIYMTTKRDSQGNPFRADKTYKLTVPNDVPVPPEQFWSLSLYSENTRRSYDNGGTEISSVSLDSRMENLQYNDDKSIDLFIGAEAPAGYESNFMKTVGEDGWFVYFRLYAPLDPFFDKTFSLPDFVEID
ncbi:DUF1214 domain-containing protein [Planktothrix agardhii]|uniref:DUF1214 domain-containing protein n=1 Tax=Planktothrix agardhii TaxID=1160 RepID=UPI0020A7D615|nr:DUF1254 domain-containing protein [Planktothrix agardhii]CAD5915939.1 hypothetical protein NO758_00344 [Planktothrix agardhii]